MHYPIIFLELKAAVAEKSVRTNKLQGTVSVFSLSSFQTFQPRNIFFAVYGGSYLRGPISEHENLTYFKFNKCCL